MKASIPPSPGSTAYTLHPGDTVFETRQQPETRPPPPIAISI
jgi:hypothetical protein